MFHTTRFSDLRVFDILRMQKYETLKTQRPEIAL